MLDKQRPTAKDLVDAVLQALFDAQEPLDDGLVLVPARFEVYLHPEAYQDLRPLLPRVVAQVTRRLDAELARLNSRRAAGLGRFFKRLFAPIARLFSADRYLQRRDARPSTYERSGDAWLVDVGVTAEPDADLDYLVVESDFGLPRQATYKGRPTLNITRRTMRLPDGRFETVLSAKRPASGRATQRTPPPARPRAERTTGGSGGTPTGVSGVRARLSFEDNQGRHIYYMKKDQIVIGRLDEDAGSLDIALDTLSDVSREHLRIRHDARSGEFAVQDLSQFGATINGHKLSAGPDDRERWHRLPRVAEIGLADIVFIQFEAL